MSDRRLAALLGLTLELAVAGLAALIAYRLVTAYVVSHL